MSLRRRSGGDPSPLDLTPCSDIIFSLLLFYILTQSLIPTLPLALPRLDAQQPPAGPAAVRLELLASGTWSWNGQALPEPGWEKDLRQRAGLLASTTAVVVLGHRLAPLGRAVEALDLLRQAGVGQISFGGIPAPAATP